MSNNVNKFMARIDPRVLTELQKRMHIDNPWWADGKIPVYFARMQPRALIATFARAVENINLRRAPILMGPRRVGKTVMLYHCIDRLLKKGIHPRKIIYMSLDTPIYGGIGLEQLLHIASENIELTEGGLYVFFDEVQYLPQWEQHLKSLVDTYPSNKFVASGSAAAALKIKSRESGAGRFSDFMLAPLTFCEYLEMSEDSLLIDPTHTKGTMLRIDKSNIQALNESFIRYLNFGGYPEVIFSDEIKSGLRQYVKDDIVEKVLMRDLPSLYGIADTQELNRFFAHIAFRSGSEFSFQNLADDAGMSKETVKKYVTYLEAAFLIKTLKRVDQNAKKMQRTTTFKIYLTSPILRNALFSPITEGDEMFVSMVETAIIDQLLTRNDDDIFYANWHKGREKGEVDIVWTNNVSLKTERVAEIKWSNRFFENPRNLKSLKYFLELNREIKDIVVTTKDELGNAEIEGRNVSFIPSSLYAYHISYNNIYGQM